MWAEATGSGILPASQLRSQEDAALPDLQLFPAALGVTPPWRVVATKFDPGQGRLDFEIELPRGARFTRPKCGQGGGPVHDAVATLA